MRKYLLILLLYPCFVHGQVVADTTLYVTTENDTIKVVTLRNLATTPFIPKIDTADAIATKHKLDSTAAALATQTAATYATITTVNGKQATLVSATNIKTINSNSLLGSGDLVLSGTGDLLAANNLSDVANAATSRTNLGLEIGVNVQAFNSNLSTIAGLTATTDNFIVSVGSAWASRTPAQVRTTLALVVGTNVQAWDADLDGWAGKTPYAGSLVITTGKTATISNTVTIAGTDGVTTTLPAVTGTVMLNTSTAGIGTSPTSSSTQTITHNLGRVPTIIRVYGYGTFTSNAAATATTSSMGVFNSSGNFCVYQRYGAAITTTQAGLTSNTFCILLATGGGSFISGVIQNVTSTQFDLVFTETGTATAQPYLWEAQ